MPCIIVNIDNTIANFTLAKNVMPADLADEFYAQNLEKLLFQVKPYPGAEEMLDHIAEFADISYTTARPIITNFVTVRWLQINGFPPGKIIFLPPEKRYFPDALGVIDDDPRVALLYPLKLANMVYIKAQPYNNTVRGCRFKTWSGLSNALDRAHQINIP
jgi:hypothetical protein